MRKFFVLYMLLFTLLFFTYKSQSKEIKINKKSGDINFEIKKEYDFDYLLRKYSFDDDLNITSAVTVKNAYFYDKDENVIHKENIKGYYGNIYFSKNKEFFTVIEYKRKNNLTQITLFNSKFETIWSSSFKFFDTKRIYISDNGENVIHYGVERTRGFASVTFIGKNGNILKKISGFLYVNDLYAYSPEKNMFLVHGSTAYDFNGEILWIIDDSYKDKKGNCRFSPDGNYIVGIYESEKYKEGELLFINSDGTIYKKHPIKNYNDSIINFSYDSRFCIIFADEKIMSFAASTGEIQWNYDLSTYITEDDVNLFLYSADMTYGAEKIALIVVQRKYGIYMEPAFLIFFSDNGNIISENVINIVNKISGFPPLVDISKDGKYLTLKFNKKIVKYVLIE